MGLGSASLALPARDRKASPHLDPNGGSCNVRGSGPAGL